MSAIIQVNVLDSKTIPKSVSMEFTKKDIIVPYVREIGEIQYHIATDFYSSSKGEVLRKRDEWFKEHNITPDKPDTEKGQSYKLCPYFEYETVQGDIKRLIFGSLEEAEKVREELTKSVIDFYSNYTDYVKVIR